MTFRDRRAGAWLLWLGVLAIATAAMHAQRETLDQAQVALTLLLVVLGGSAFGGRALGLTLACLGFLVIDYYFQPPFDTLAVQKRVDWIILLAFLATASVAAWLLDRAQAQAEQARRRTQEVASLSRLGAEMLNAGRSEEALHAIAGAIRDTLGVAACSIEPDDLERGDAGEVRMTAGEGLPAVLPERSVLRLRLEVHGKVAGILALADVRPIRLDAAQRRFLEVLAYYAALAAERVRLMGEAEHAAALREADRMKDVVLASVSHDLRTPLTAIKALAGDHALGETERRAAIEEQVDRLTRVVGDLLDLSRMQAGAFHIDPETNTAEDLIGAVSRQLAATAAGRLSVHVDLDHPALVGRFDFVQALRALSNVVENALRYSPPDARVELSVAREGDRLAFQVADRGPGIASGDRGCLFEPFQRPAGRPSDAGSAGLGLSIARRLAEVQGGSLKYSPRDGGGSVFTLRLPALDLTEPHPTESFVKT